MIDITNKNDIINLSTKGADFLCQQYPLVCAVELKPFLWSTQKAGFLLENNMAKGLRGFQKGHPVFTTKGDFKKGHKTWNKGKVLKQFHRENSFNWKRGRNSSRGYIRIYLPEHPFCNCDGYIFEHRVVVEKNIGRYLISKEKVHHKNGIRDDNRIENLEIVVSTPHYGKIKCPYCQKRFLIQ